MKDRRHGSHTYDDVHVCTQDVYAHTWVHMQDSHICGIVHTHARRKHTWERAHPSWPRMRYRKTTNARTPAVRTHTRGRTQDGHAHGIISRRSCANAHTHAYIRDHWQGETVWFIGDGHARLRRQYAHSNALWWCDFSLLTLLTGNSGGQVWWDVYWLLVICIASCVINIIVDLYVNVSKRWIVHSSYCTYL